jgi:predicted O-methyltransferase YrrM
MTNRGRKRARGTDRRITMVFYFLKYLVKHPKQVVIDGYVKEKKYSGGIEFLKEVDSNYADASISDLEFNKLCSLVKDIKTPIIFEIGTHKGKTAIRFSEAIPDATIYTLDIEKKHNKKADNIEWLYGDSRYFDFTPYYGQIDLMFIDGDHNYDAVLSDSMNALKCIKPTGFIAWHDVDIQHPFTANAIKDFLELYQIDKKYFHKEGYGSLAYYHKNEMEEL